MNFSKDELVNMVYALGEADRNLLLATRLYKTKFPNARQPRIKTMRRVRETFENTGNVAYPKKEVLANQLSDDTVLNVLLAVEENPHTSVREISRAIGVPKSTINDVLRRNSYHPYHLELHQELHEADFAQRVDFCNTILASITLDGNFVGKILFSDEATFKSNGSVNRHNMHYYATENPHWLRTIDHTNRWSLNVWAGILKDHVIGPFFFEQTLTGVIYLDFLENELPVMLENVDLATRAVMWFQHDGAPVHFQRNVRRYLDNWLPGRWIGRGGTVSWPPRSPDLTPLDFFFMGTR